jgi:hypothetical protein
MCSHRHWEAEACSEPTLNLQVEGYATPVWRGARNWYKRQVVILPVTYENVGTSFRRAGIAHSR